MKGMCQVIHYYVSLSVSGEKPAVLVKRYSSLSLNYMCNPYIILQNSLTSSLTECCKVFCELRCDYKICLITVLASM